jgi:hypothetical protein
MIFLVFICCLLSCTDVQLHAMSRSERIEKKLARARSAIRQAARSRSYGSYSTREDFFPRGPLYINPYAFYQLRFSPPYLYYYFFFLSFLE